MEMRLKSFYANLNRLLSLDVMRGLIMFLLAAESCFLYISLRKVSDGGPFEGLIRQFEHHPWHGLYFWDLVQPAFMFIAGTAMYYSYQSRLKKGLSWRANMPQILKRCFRLFILGVALHCIYAGRMVFELWNVLTQLSFTLFITYLIIRMSLVQQFLISMLFVLSFEVLFRMVNIPGYDQPFVMGKNFGSWFDMLVMGKINGDGWVAINILTTTAHSIWGAMAGKILLESRNDGQRMKFLLLGAIGLLVMGYALDLSGITPIIKRIATSSFTLVSGGYVILMLLAMYWIYDVWKFRGAAFFFSVIGMNPIFIYLFFQTVGVQWLNRNVAIFTNGMFGWMGFSEEWLAVIAALGALAVNWYLCYWLYKKRIVFKV